VVCACLNEDSLSCPNQASPSQVVVLLNNTKAAKPGVYFLSFLKLPTMSSSAWVSSPPLSLSSLPVPLQHTTPQCVKRYQIRFEHCECHVINSKYSMNFFRILRAVPICPSFKNDALLVRVQLDTRAVQRYLQATLQQEVCVAECCMTVYCRRYPNRTRVVIDTATRGLRCIVLQYVPEHNTGICRQHCKRRSVLQCIAMCCCVLQRVAVHTRVYQRSLPATWSWIASCLDLPSASDHEIRFVALMRLDW